MLTALLLALSLATTSPGASIKHAGPQPPHFWMAFTVACGFVGVVVAAAIAPLVPGARLTDEEFDDVMDVARTGGRPTWTGVER